MEGRATCRRSLRREPGSLMAREGEYRLGDQVGSEVEGAMTLAGKLHEYGARHRRSDRLRGLQEVR